jgi:hypothetical protein
MNRGTPALHEYRFWSRIFGGGGTHTWSINRLVTRREAHAKAGQDPLKRPSMAISGNLCMAFILPNTALKHIGRFKDSHQQKIQQTLNAEEVAGIAAQAGCSVADEV